MTDKRKRIESFIDELMMTLDPTGVNSRKYKDMFQVMSDDDFKEWVEGFLADKKSQLRLDIEEFGERRLTFENIEKAAKLPLINLELFDYIYLPHLSSNPNRPIRSKEKVLIGELNVKRPQQLVSNKTGLSLSDRERDDMTGAAKGDSKGGRTTGIENELLAGVGADAIISEICGVRGDNAVEYDNMITSINEKGSAKLADIKTNIYDKPTLLMTDILFKCMGLKTDIITESYYNIDKVRSAINDV